MEMMETTTVNRTSPLARKADGRSKDNGQIRIVPAVWQRKSESVRFAVSSDR